MFVCELFVWFCIISVFGWMWESAYCTLMERSWQNRGFLFGPFCPIYGVSGLAIMLIVWVLGEVRQEALDPGQVFVVSALTSAVVEYVTSYILERAFHARWWDYSEMPLNLNGRICLPATVLFGVAGIGCVFVAQEVLSTMTAWMGPLWCEVVALLAMGSLGADVAITISALTRFQVVAASINDSVNRHMEEFVAGVFEQEEAAAAMVAAERRRFGDALRASRVHQMGAAVRAAASRMYAIRGRSLSVPTGLQELLQELKHR